MKITILIKKINSSFNSACDWIDFALGSQQTVVTTYYRVNPVSFGVAFVITELHS